MLVNLKNGPFEIDEGRLNLRKPDRNDFLTCQLPFCYDVNAKYPFFEYYLNTVLPDIERQQVLAEYPGYLFIKPSVLKFEKALRPYGEPFTLINYAKLIFNCNELSKEVEQTTAYFRRFLIIPFDIAIPEERQDKQIIGNELSGVFNRVLEGLKRLLHQKQFTRSESVDNILDTYMRESNSVILFLEEEGYRASLEEYVQLKDLYNEYKLFCFDGSCHPVSKRNFSYEVKKVQFTNKIVYDCLRGYCH